MLNRITPPSYQTIQEVAYIKANTEYLSNGIPVHVINAGKQPVLGIEFIFKSGTKYEPENGVAFFTTKMLSEGTKTRNAAQISSYIDQFGAYLQLNAAPDFSTLEVYTMAKHAAPIIKLASELITTSVFPETELNSFKNIQQQQLRVNNEKSNVLASKKLKAALFGTNHPYGKSLTEEAIVKIDRGMLHHYFTQHYQYDFEIILSGQVAPQTVSLLEKYFGNIEQPADGQDTKLAGETTPDQRHRIVIDKPQNLQSSIRVGKALILKKHPDFAKMKVVNTLLGGYFGSRLMRNIREDKGFTYGISSGIATLQETGYLVIGTDVKKEFTLQTLEEIYKEIDKLQREPVGKEELHTLKNYMAGRLLSSVDTPFALADKFKNVYLYGLDYEYYTRYLQTINQIDADTIQDIAKKYLQTDTMKEVIVGGLN